MFTVKNTWFLITFIFCVLDVSAEVRSEGCNNRYEVPEWLSPLGTLPPGLLSLTRVSSSQAGIAVQVSKIEDNVTLSLFALPFAKSKADCLSPEMVYSKLIESRKNHKLIAGKNELETKYFRRMFTGCYYFELTNSTNHKWIWDGFFFDSPYEYHDTKVGCENVFEPAYGNKSMQLRYELSLGKTCLKLRCRLYELATIHNNTEVDIDNELIPPSQECNITYIANGTQPNINCLNPLGLTLVSPDPVMTDERGRWTTVVTWTNLKEGGAHYYAQLLQFNHTCNMPIRDLAAWRPAVQVGGIIHGYQNQSRTPPSIDTSNPAHTDNIVIPPTEDAEVLK